MPETPVDENGNSRAAKNEVRSTPDSWEYRSVDAIAEPARMERTSQQQFGLGVALPGARHTLTGLR